MNELGEQRPMSEADVRRPLDRVGTDALEDARFRNGLAVLLEGSIRGIVGEYGGEYRVRGHKPCRHCGCAGAKA